MTSENTDSVAVGTIKAHGIAIGDAFNFHGMATGDAIPTAEATRVKFAGKVGNKYMLVSVMGDDIMTWEFGPSAKIYADTSVAHYVTTEARTLDNGDTVHVGTCEHGWMTGFHTTDDDARAVATGHGEVSRPLYVPTCICDDIIASGPAPIERVCPCGNIFPAMAVGTAPVAEVAEVSPVAVGDVVVINGTGMVGMVEKTHASGMVRVVGISDIGQREDFYPIALTVVTDDMVKSAQETIKRNGRVFCAEAGNFGVPACTFLVLAAHGWATLVSDGDMSRWVRTRYTADRKVITDGLAVWDYNLDAGHVDLSTIDSDGWFYVNTLKGGRSLMNGERVCVAHPADGVTAEEFIAGTALPIDIPTPAEVDALKAEHDAAMDAWAAPLVKILSPGLGSIADSLAEADKRHAARLAAEVPPAVVEIHTGDGDVITEADVKARFREAFGPSAGVSHVGSEVSEAEVWAGTDTMITYPLSRPNQTKMRRRARKSTRRARRGIKGGF